MSLLSEMVGRFKGAWATLQPETKGQIMEELGIPVSFNPYPTPKAEPVDLGDVEFIEGEVVEKDPPEEDLDDVFGV